MASTRRKRSAAAKKNAKSVAASRKVKVSPKVTLASLALMLAAAALAGMFAFPQFLSFRETSAQLAADRAAISDLSVRIEQAAVSGDADLAELYARVKELEDVLPTAPSREEVTVAVVQLADSLGVQVQRFDPAGESEGTDLARFSFSARFSGTYGAIVNLLDGLERLGPLITFNQVQFSSQGDLFTLSMTMDVWFVTFPRLTDDEGTGLPVPAPADSDDVLADDVLADDVLADDVLADDEADPDGEGSGEELLGPDVEDGEDGAAEADDSQAEGDATS